MLPCLAMTRPRGPTYPLEDIKAAVRAGNWCATTRAFETALQIWCEESDIRECVLALPPRSFHKTMPSEKMPGTMQDVYKTKHYSWPVYLKMQLDAAGTTVVISFKLDEDP